MPTVNKRWAQTTANKSALFQHMLGSYADFVSHIDFTQGAGIGLVSKVRQSDNVGDKAFVTQQQQLVLLEKVSVKKKQFFNLANCATTKKLNSSNIPATQLIALHQNDKFYHKTKYLRLKRMLAKLTVCPDWAIFERPWKHIFLLKMIKLLAFLGYFEKCHSLSRTAEGAF